MKPPGPIWVDERNPIYRRGLVTSLQGEGFSIAGESVALRPAPELARTSLLILDVDAAGLTRACPLARQSDLAVIGLLRDTPAGDVRELLAEGMAAALALRTLTPARLLWCIRRVAERNSSQPAHPPTPAAVAASLRGRTGGNRRLTPRELDVLARLAEGDNTEEIARQMSYSERTVKNIVHDLRSKLDGRTRAHAVAVAARRGLI